MTLPIKVGLGFLGVSGISGVGYLGSKLIFKESETKETFRTKYSKAIIDTKQHSNTWNKKLTILSGELSKPKNEKLIRSKQEKVSGKTENAESYLKQGCEEIYSKGVGNDDDFQDFKNFCSFNNGDKIPSGKSLITSKTDFSSHWNTFKVANKNDLHERLRKVYEQKGANSTDNDWQQKMLDECNNISSDIFSEELSSFNSFCTKSGG